MRGTKYYFGIINKKSGLCGRFFFERRARIILHPFPPPKITKFARNIGWMLYLFNSIQPILIFFRVPFRVFLQDQVPEPPDVQSRLWLR